MRTALRAVMAAAAVSATALGQAVRAWGAGTTGTGSEPSYGQSIVPTDLGPCTAVSAGAWHNADDLGYLLSRWGPCTN